MNANGRRAWKLLKETAASWSSHKAPRLGAALAFYTLLSIAPLLVLVVAIFRLVLDRTSAQQQLLQQVQALAGTSVSNSLQSILLSHHHAGHGIMAGIIAIGTLLFGASGVFVELREDLNLIWDAPPVPSSTVRQMVFQRLVSFAMVLSLGGLLLLSLLASAALAVVTRLFQGLVPLPAAILGEVANIIFPLIALSILFALIYKFVPDVPISWRDVSTGAVATSALFVIGKGLLTLYLATAGVGSTYGAAGSLVAFVVWVYYSAQIFFFGAVFTQVYASNIGSHSPDPRSAPASKADVLPAASRSASA